MLVGCASTPTSFYKNRAAVGNTALCKTVRSGNAAKDPAFRGDVIAELERRGLTPNECDRLIRKQQAAIAAAILAGAVVAIAAEGGGGGGGGGSYVADYQWEWDEFYDQYGNLIWRCRGVQTGQFAEDSRCGYKVKSDWKWPSKRAL